MDQGGGGSRTICSGGYDIGHPVGRVGAPRKTGSYYPSDFDVVEKDFAVATATHGVSFDS